MILESPWVLFVVGVLNLFLALRVKRPSRIDERWEIVWKALRIHWWVVGVVAILVALRLALV